MSACLSSEQIERFTAGDLGAEEAGACSDHIAECEKCAQAIEAHRRGESMLDMLRTDHSDATHSLGPGDEVSVRPSSGVEATYPKIDGYRILGVLGQGGMGIVYRAVQTKLSRTVALKVLPAVVGTANPSAVERFKREATAAAQLHHTHIVPIYDFGESSDAYYYAMELIEGQPLDVVIKRLAAQNAPGTSPVQFAQLLHRSTAAADDFEIVVQNAKSTSSSSGSGSTIGSSSTGRGRAYYRQVARWMADAGEALQFAHDQDIIHRDIKPANFLITMDHRIMVADFGLAKTAGEQSVTMVGSLIGTLRYMSPEQAMAKRVRLDHRTDIYSLGVTMYELLTFRPAFPGQDEKEILGSIIAREPTSARKIDPHVPSELETICFKAMEKLPDARYDTARALADDLRRWSNDLPITAKPPGVRVLVTKFLRRHRVATLAVAVLALVVLSVVLALGFREQQRSAKAARATQIISEVARLHQEREYAQAEDLLRELLESDPEHFRALGNLAINLKEQYRTAPYGEEDINLLEESVSLCERAVERMSQLGDDVSIERRAGLYIVYAVSLYLTDRLDDAEDACRRALEYMPNSYNAQSNLAKVYLLKELRQEALTAALKGTDAATQEERENGLSVYMAPVWRTLGTVHLMRGEKEAIPALEHAILCKPGGKFSLILLARALMDLEHDYERALFRAEAAADFDADPPDPRIVRTLALAHLRAKEYKKALSVAAGFPNTADMQVLNNLIMAVAHARLGDIERAQFRLTSAKENWPEDLRESGDTRTTVHKAVFWFDTADELIALRDEAESLIHPADDRP